VLFACLITVGGQVFARGLGVQLPLSAKEVRKKKEDDLVAVFHVRNNIVYIRLFYHIAS